MPERLRAANAQKASPIGQHPNTREHPSTSTTLAKAPRTPVSLWRTPRSRGLLLVSLLALLYALASAAAHVYTDALWFGELGQERVYWTTFAYRVLPLTVVGLATSTVLLATLARRPAAAPAALAGGVLSVLRLPDDFGWKLALWTHRGDFGHTDPVFHKDDAFYVFSLPLYDALCRWLLEVVVMAAVLTALAAWRRHGLGAARRHLLALAGVGALLFAWRLRLDAYALVLPHEGSVVPGASHTDVHARLPILRAYTVIALLVAGACLYAAAFPARLTRFAVPAAGLAIVAAAIAGFPGLVERLDVAPQALSRERPYVQQAIASTRRAFALDAVEERTPGPGQSALAEHQDTIDNVPLWDPSVLRAAADETRALSSYYSFGSLTVDRYGDRLYTLGARRVDLTDVAPEARGWINDHFAYTHGYGIAAVHAGEADADGYPRFGGALSLTQPRIFFGERAPNALPYAILDSHRGEVERPAPGSRPSTYHYDGRGGIPVSGLLRRVAFALRFDDLDLALTETLGPRARIAIRRDAHERVATLAPFLRWDERPQTVVAGGRVSFLFHGYTSSASFPYSQRVHGVNYLRAPVLAVVDAFDGHTTLHALEPDEPLLKAWRALYPGLFAPRTALPAALRAHVRYPERLFQAQAAIYATYHAADPTSFWTGSDVWSRANELAGPVEDAGELQFPDARGVRTTPPAFLLARLPGDREPRLMLTQGYTPRGRENLVAYLAGSVDAELRPRLTVLSLPRDRLTTGPTQATRQILADPGVDRTLQVLNRESRDLGRASVNRTILGRPRIVPFGDELVHVQPVYVTAGGSGFPRLQLVTVFARGRIGYGRDLRQALRRAGAL